MPKLTDARRQLRRDQIADAAMRVFARAGLANATMTDIIEEAGLSAGSVYSHFSSKAELLRFAFSSTVESRFSALINGAAPQAGAITPAEVLRRVLEEGRLEGAQAQALLHLWSEVQRDPELAAIARENIQRLRARISETIAPWVDTHRGVGASAVADAVLTAVLGYVTRVALDPQTPARAVLQAILSGFESEPRCIRPMSDVRAGSK